MPNRTLYLTQQNYDTLSSEENASGLVNRLLTNYFAGRTSIHPTRIVEKTEKDEVFEQLKQKYDIAHKKPYVDEDQTVVPPELTA